uniref:Salivary secreted protein n=1 Tax=Mayetiola destructor TaxID=39758 RepID=Q6W004_MAYDE|nr:salivary secreted protein [Mayetiola destructor]
MKYSLAFLFVASTAFLMASAAPKRAAQQSGEGSHVEGLRQDLANINLESSAPRTEAQLRNELRLAQHALDVLGRRVPDLNLSQHEKLADAEQLRKAKERVERASAALNRAR